MSGPARSGFTLMELLVAAALGATVMALAIDQVTKYFRLQQALMSRAELRQELKVAQQQIMGKLRYANHLLPQFDSANAFATIPIDANGNGVLDANDRMQVIWWRVMPDALGDRRTALVEQVVETGAFDPGNDSKVLETLFAKAPGHGRQLAPRFSQMTIASRGPGLWEVSLSATIVLVQTQQTISQTLVERVALRSQASVAWLPTLAERLLDAGGTP